MTRPGGHGVMHSSTPNHYHRVPTPTAYARLNARAEGGGSTGAGLGASCDPLIPVADSDVIKIRGALRVLLSVVQLSDFCQVDSS